MQYVAKGMMNFSLYKYGLLLSKQKIHYILLAYCFRRASTDKTGSKPLSTKKQLHYAKLCHSLPRSCTAPLRFWRLPSKKGSRSTPLFDKQIFNDSPTFLSVL